MRIIDSALGQFPLIGNDLPRGRLTGVDLGRGRRPGRHRLRRARHRPGRPERHEHHLGGAAQPSAEPDQGAATQPACSCSPVGLGILGTTALSSLVAAAAAFGAQLGISVRLPATLAAIALNSLIFLAAFRIATAREVTWRDNLPGAIGAAVVWQLLQLLGAQYVSTRCKTAGATYGAFGLVFGLLAFIYLEAMAVVLCAEANSVLTRRLWPRALLTPFTDDVDLTAADEHAYASYAEAQRHKGFERIEVTFRDRPARRRPRRRPPRARH